LPLYVSPFACRCQVMSTPYLSGFPLTSIDCYFDSQFPTCICPPHLIQFATRVEQSPLIIPVTLTDSVGATTTSSTKLFLPIQLQHWPTQILFPPCHTIPTIMLECFIAPVDNIYVPIDLLYNLCRQQSQTHQGVADIRWNTGPDPTAPTPIAFGVFYNGLAQGGRYISNEPTLCPLNRDPLLPL
jgi:hypothetical protein